MDQVWVGIMIGGFRIALLWPLSYALGTLQRVQRKVVYPLLRVKQGNDISSFVKKGGYAC